MSNRAALIVVRLAGWQSDSSQEKEMTVKEMRTLQMQVNARLNKKGANEGNKDANLLFNLLRLLLPKKW